jgi:hypothetical protein
MTCPSLGEQRTWGGNRVISDILRQRPLLLFVIQRRLFSTRSSILKSAQIVQSSLIAEVKPGPFDGRLLGTVPSGRTLTRRSVARAARPSADIPRYGRLRDEPLIMNLTWPCLLQSAMRATKGTPVCNSKGANSSFACDTRIEIIEFHSFFCVHAALCSMDAVQCT